MKALIKLFKQFFCCHHAPNTFISFGGPCPRHAYPVSVNCVKCGKLLHDRWEMRRPK